MFLFQFDDWNLISNEGIDYLLLEHQELLHAIPIMLKELLKPLGIVEDQVAREVKLLAFQFSR